MMTMSAVVPVARSDLDRLRLVLIPSLMRYFEPLERLWVVVPSVDLALAREACASWPDVTVISEGALVPELEFFDTPAVRISLLLSRPLLDTEPDRVRQGWFRQQLIKLAFARVCSTDFYVYLDADVICTRSPRGDDLIRDGKGRYQLDPDHAPRAWFDWSARALEVAPACRPYGVTPAVLSREAVFRLADYITSLDAVRAHRLLPWLRLFGPPGGASDSWIRDLAFRLPWTEHALYFTYLESAGLLDDYHFYEPGRAVYGNSVWSGSSLTDWDPRQSFRDDAPFVFSVVQSNRRVPAVELQRRLARWLG